MNTTSHAEPNGAGRRVLLQGAGRGLGRAMAAALLESGDVTTLFATARDRNAAGLRALAERFGERVQCLGLDITDETSIEAAMRRVAECSEYLDWVIVCAGVLHDQDGLRPEKCLADVSPDNLRHSFEVNALGPLLMLKHCERLLCAGNAPVFASISARVGSIGDNRRGGWYGYRASKAALNQFTRTASIELRRKSPRAICVGLHPGTTDTALSRPFQRNVPRGKLFTPEFAATSLLGVLDRLTPEDSGGVFAWDGERIAD